MENREIKFRGKSIHNGEWLYGYFVKDPKNESRIYYKPFEEATSNTYHFVHPESVGQYTGLKDKNGKEIYEGDIIAYDMHYSSGELINLLVKWDNNNCFYRGYFEETAGHSLNNFSKSHYEILGNIYENKNLLDYAKTT